MKLEVWSLSTIARSLGQEWNQVKLTSEAREALSGRKIVLLVEVWRKKKIQVQFWRRKVVEDWSHLTGLIRKRVVYLDHKLTAQCQFKWGLNFALHQNLGQVSLWGSAEVQGLHFEFCLWLLVYDFISLVSQLILNSFALCHNYLKDLGKWIFIKNMFLALSAWTCKVLSRVASWIAFIIYHLPSVWHFIPLSGWSSFAEQDLYLMVWFSQS